MGRARTQATVELLDAHRAALGNLLELAIVPGGHSVLWDALEETAEAIADFLER